MVLCWRSGLGVVVRARVRVSEVECDGMYEHRQRASPPAGGQGPLGACAGASAEPRAQAPGGRGRERNRERTPDGGRLPSGSRFFSFLRSLSRPLSRGPMWPWSRGLSSATASHDQHIIDWAYAVRVSQGPGRGVRPMTLCLETRPE